MEAHKAIDLSDQITSQMVNMEDIINKFASKMKNQFISDNEKEDGPAPGNQFEDQSEASTVDNT